MDNFFSHGWQSSNEYFFVTDDTDYTDFFNYGCKIYARGKIILMYANGAAGKTILKPIVLPERLITRQSEAARLLDCFE